MKKLLSAALPAILCLIFSMNCNAQKIFSELAAIPGVQSTCIGTEDMSQGMNKQLLGNMDFGDITSGIVEEVSMVETIISTDDEVTEKVKSKFGKILKKLKLTLITETTDGEDSVAIYAIPSPAGKDAGYTDLVVVTSDESDFILVHIAGKINMAAQE